MDVYLPRWSPDRRRIAFTGGPPGGTGGIYLLSSEGGTPQELMPGEHNREDPSWSPDGNSLCFGASDPGEGGASRIRLLELRTPKVSTLPGSEGLRSPVWSPDGRYVAAVTSIGQKLRLFDFTAQKWSELGEVMVSNLTWSRNGTYIYFDSWADSAIFRVRIADRKVERVVNLRHVSRAFSSTSFWMGLAPDDSPLVLRDASTQEIYALDWEAP